MIKKFICLNSALSDTRITGVHLAQDRIILIIVGLRLRQHRLHWLLVSQETTQQIVFVLLPHRGPAPTIQDQSLRQERSHSCDQQQHYQPHHDDVRPGLTSCWASSRRDNNHMSSSDRIWGWVRTDRVWGAHFHISTIFSQGHGYITSTSTTMGTTDSFACKRWATCEHCVYMC